MPKLTVRTVESVVPGSSDIFLWDTDLTGFGLRVKPTGLKTYFIQYRTKGGTSRRYTIGRHGVLKPEEARTRALKLLASIADGKDPAKEARQALSDPTVRDLAARYEKEVAEPHAKPSYLAQIKRMLKSHVLPAFGSEKVDAVTRRDVQNLHTRLKETPYEANRVLALISVLFKHAELWHLRTEGTNPARLVKRYREKRRERLLTDAEVARIMTVLNSAEWQGAAAPSASLAIRLLFATACRASEILGLKWSYISEETAQICWPDSKTGEMKKPLTAEIRALLKSAIRIVGNPYVCPAPLKRASGMSLTTLEKVWRRLLEKAGVPHCGLHAIRHRVATDIANSGVPIHVGMRLTGHRTYETFRRYLHTEHEATLKAAEEVARRRVELVSATSASTTVNVTPMKATH